MDAPEKKTADRTGMAWPAHVIPFAAWLALLYLPGSPSGWTYAVRSVAGLVLLFAYRTWRGYAPLHIRNLPLSALVGVLVFLVWVLPETKWAARWPALQDFYLKYAVLPWGRAPEVLSPAPYAPEVCGWPLAIVRLLGSALVISFIEEFFWRGFIYRWITARDFRSVDLGSFSRNAFFITALLFGLEHDRWLVGILAGLAYGALVLKTRDLWAAGIAHAITNFLLGLYVLAAGAYGFW